MRRVSLKHQPLVDAGNANAAQLIADVGKCEFCLRDFVPITQHEILQGALRRKTRVDRSCVLVICPECHGVLHSMGKPNSILCALALLQRSRLDDYDLPKVNYIAKPEAPNRYSVYEVDLWSSRLGERS
jgi:hypothetical protein